MVQLLPNRPVFPINFLLIINLLVLSVSLYNGVRFCVSPVTIIYTGISLELTNKSISCESCAAGTSFIKVYDGIKPLIKEFRKRIIIRH